MCYNFQNILWKKCYNLFEETLNVHNFCCDCQILKMFADLESPIFPLSNTYDLMHFLCLKYQLNCNFVQLVEKCHLVGWFNERVLKSWFSFSLIEFIFLCMKEIHVSSAYNRMSQYLTDCGRSLMYMRKSKGPKIDPCGTPHTSSAGSDKKHHLTSFLTSILNKFHWKHIKSLIYAL